MINDMGVQESAVLLDGSCCEEKKHISEFNIDFRSSKLDNQPIFQVGI